MEIITGSREDLIDMLDDALGQVGQVKKREQKMAFYNFIGNLYGSINVNSEENYPIDYVAIEGIQNFGMPVGQTTFETCYFIGRLLEQFEAFDIEPTLIYRSEEKMLLCHSMKATDATIRQALIDLFAKDTPNKGKGTKKEPGYFYGFKADAWSAFSIAYVFHTKYIGTEC